MPLHPQCAAFLDQLAASGGKPLQEIPLPDVRAMAAPPEIGGPERSLHRVHDTTIPGPNGSLAVRVYQPSGDANLPGLVYFHPGGFVLGNLDMVDRQCRELAHQSGAVVVSVDYRLAPENPFPAAVDDAYAATRYVAEHAGSFGIDPARLAVGGESAGGNLAAVVAVLARDNGNPRLVFQLLVTPVTDFTDDSPSLREFATGLFLTTAMHEYFMRLYLPNSADHRNPRASPMLADLHGVAPALVITAECDPIRDQGEAYARKLAAADVAVTLTRYDGMIHSFFDRGGVIDDGRRAVADAAAALRRATS
jgi:acetyl esterase